MRYTEYNRQVVMFPDRVCEVVILTWNRLPQLYVIALCLYVYLQQFDHYIYIRTKGKRPAKKGKSIWDEREGKLPVQYVSTREKGIIHRTKEEKSIDRTKG